MREKTRNKLFYLAETKSLIKSALIEKGQEVADGDDFRSYVDKIRAISGGGSADERVKYVTFMWEDVELIKYPVIVGGTCKDPVNDPINNDPIGTPTKEPTVSTVYSFDGWSLTDGGEVDENALANVTEDRTVYVAFTESAREYTITFLDDDGTELETQCVAYGETPSYSGTLEKDGYAFDGWKPEIATVTADATYTASWIESVEFANASWSKVVEKATDGSASTAWAIGDTKDLELNYADGTSETVTVQIASFGKCTTEDGGKDNMTIVLKQPLQKLIRYDLTTLTSLDEEAYNAIEFIKYLRETVFPALPQELQEAIKPRQVCFYTGATASQHKYSYQNVWGIRKGDINVSCSEVFGTANQRIMTPRNSTEAVNWYRGELTYINAKYWATGYDTNGAIIQDTNYRDRFENAYNGYQNGVVFGFCI